MRLGNRESIKSDVFWCHPHQLSLRLLLPWLNYEKARDFDSINIRIPSLQLLSSTSQALHALIPHNLLIQIQSTPSSLLLHSYLIRRQVLRELPGWLAHFSALHCLPLLYSGFRSWWLLDYWKNRAQLFRLYDWLLLSKRFDHKPVWCSCWFIHRHHLLSVLDAAQHWVLLILAHLFLILQWQFSWSFHLPLTQQVLLYVFAIGVHLCLWLSNQRAIRRFKIDNSVGITLNISSSTYIFSIGL